MKLQWHPSSGRRNVFTLEVEGAPAALLTVSLAAAALLWMILPVSLGAVLDRWRRGRAEAEVEVLNARRHEALELATSALRLSGERLAADRGRPAGGGAPPAPRDRRLGARRVGARGRFAVGRRRDDRAIRAAPS